MEVSTVSNVFALTIIVGSVVLIGAAFVPAGRKLIGAYAPILITLAALGATLGSLYYSDSAKLSPCLYCWYQRIAMYPIALIGIVSVATKDRKAMRYSLGLGLIGVALAAYHIQLQATQTVTESCSLQSTTPCSSKLVQALGFITIPQMAGATFLAIVVLSIVGLRYRTDTGDTTEALDAERDDADPLVGSAS